MEKAAVPLKIPVLLLACLLLLVSSWLLGSAVVPVPLLQLWYRSDINLGMRMARFTSKRPEGVAEHFEALPPVAYNKWHGLASRRHGLDPGEHACLDHNASNLPRFQPKRSYLCNALLLKLPDASAILLASVTRPMVCNRHPWEFVRL